jgi:hypothetical protein
MAINPNASTQGDRVMDEKRDYQRVLPSSKSRQALRERGMSWVLSSNVSAIGTSAKDLYVRFHNGAIYVYYKKADLFEAMYKSSSKGRFVWTQLRRTNVPYAKVGSMPLEEDKNVSDEDIMKVGISTQKVKRLNQMANIAALGAKSPALINMTIKAGAYTSKIALLQ